MTDYELVVACILGATFFTAAVITLFGWMMPKTGYEASDDPYAEEFPGLYAPRERE